ncbi:hypothetical protein [Spirosoma arcticum]
MTTDALIQRIADLQTDAGLFPSVRSNPAIGYRRPDTNVFFTAITVFTLRQLRPVISPESQRLIDQIQERAVAAYPLFRNKDGLGTYNFWPTRPSQHFPNGYLFRHFDHFRIPDDIDDTAMVYLTTQPTAAADRPDELNWLKTKLAQHANGTTRRIQTTFADYRHLRAYSTWFGKNMGIDFDACAMSNMLYCLYQYGVPLDQHRADSLTYLRAVVESGRYVSEPFRCAPHYARTSLIIYHLTRLIAAFDPPELASIRPRLVADARHLLTKATNRMEQLVLNTSLLRLGERPPVIEVADIEQDFSTFHFFIAGLLTAYEQPIVRRWADRSFTQMRWQCEAHCWALVLEYLTLGGSTAS